jgi:hypothetical protein
MAILGSDQSQCGITGGKDEAQECNQSSEERRSENDVVNKYLLDPSRLAHAVMTAIHNDGEPSFAVASISPLPAQLSDTALTIASYIAFAGAVLALALALSHVACGTSIDSMVSRSSTVAWTQMTAQPHTLQSVCEDDHYKYLIPLLIPASAWFVIANWVGWEFFSNA